jgi:hypothetical protein
MTTIPDEVVREMLKAYGGEDFLQDVSDCPEIENDMRRAAEVAVKWAREEQKEKDADIAEGEYLFDVGLIVQKTKMEMTALMATEIAAAIRNQKD